MSYVLDALKKLEYEKARKAMPGSMGGIAGDLFREQPARSISSGRWKMALVVLVVIASSSAATWFYLRAPQRPPGHVQQPVAASLPATVAAPVGVGHQEMQQAVSPVLETPPGGSPRPLPVNGPDTADMGGAAAHAAQREHGEAPHPQRPVGVPLRRKTSAETVPVSTQPVQAPLDIKVSGIAWQDDRSLRRAVVNGLLLQEGAVVSGVKITEIQQDKVRFASQNGSFVVRLDIASTPGQQN